MSTFSLSKKERLKSKKSIEELMDRGKSLNEFPIRAIYLFEEDSPISNNFPVRMAVSVPKRNFKKAVDRNKLKRQIREAYRTHKSILYNHCTSKNISCSIMLIYTGKDHTEFSLLRDKIILTLQRLTKTN